MKKILLAASIAFLGSTVVSSNDLTNTKIEAQAKIKKYPISKNFAQSLKKGTLPRAKGKIGMKYTTLIKQKGIKGKLIKYSDGHYGYDESSVLNKDTYMDYYSFDSKNLKVAKVQSIFRTYGYSIAIKSFNPYFKRPLKYVYENGLIGPTSYPTIYKTGKYYTSIQNLGYDHEYFKPDSNGGTETCEVIISTKKIALAGARGYEAVDFK